MTANVVQPLWSPNGFGRLPEIWHERFSGELLAGGARNGLERMVLVTHNPCLEYWLDLQDAGVGAVLCAPSAQLLAQTVARVAQGQRLRIEQKSSLLPSERLLLRHLPGGECNKRIAKRLGLSERTVRNRLVEVAEKLGLENRTQIAMYYAGQWQWLARYRQHFAPFVPDGALGNAAD